MFNVGVEIMPALELLKDIRRKTSAIADDVREAVKGPIAKQTQDLADKLLSKPASEPEHPFLFASANSRAFYFAAMKNGLFDSQSWNKDGGQWSRTGTLESGWLVEIDPRTTRVNTIMTITNAAVDEKGDSYSQAVYGPEPVPGHAVTGWENIVDDNIDAIVDSVEQALQDALDNALAAFNS